ncbi:hypothetical protein [Microlunatus speluncae]|uniref:hypothetical protein n=1 Tax=Microlunatus speluncae TaxID=2594267 RepID=UPI0012664DD4|nr:hypothetical protein [Microlunatus speluncae]
MITLLDVFLPEASRRSRPSRPAGRVSPAQRRLWQAELYGPTVPEEPRSARERAPRRVTARQRAAGSAHIGHADDLVVTR